MRPFHEVKHLTLDRLLERQDAIQNNLAKAHLSNGCIVLYNITSTYFEGQYKESETVSVRKRRPPTRTFR